jgi:hypothetical protein
LLRFHDSLKKRKYRWLFSSGGHRRPGPKGPSKELIDAIVEFKRRNPHVGCPRITQEIAHTFGIDIDKDAKHYRPWLTLIGHMKDSLWSVDVSLRIDTLAQPLGHGGDGRVHHVGSLALALNALTSVASRFAGCSTRSSSDSRFLST